MVAGTAARDTYVERASMEASFASMRRTLVVGLLTASVVISALLITGGVPLGIALPAVAALMATRMIAAWTAWKGLEATTLADQRRWTDRLEWALVPLGAMSGLAPALIPMDDGQITPQWFGLMVCTVAVGASNILLGYGRSRTFLALSVPLMLGALVSTVLVGGIFALAFAPGVFVVGGILVFDNREAGAMFRDARRFEEENRSLVVELQAANVGLDRRVHTDSLTGLGNRAGLRRCVESLADSDNALEVIYVDLDGFKAVNDNHGHAAGDEVLRATGERLNRVVRPADFAARIGGDEFVVVAEIHSGDANPLDHRIREALEAPIRVADHQVHLGVSMGVQRCNPGDDLGLIVRLADAAMYDEKSARRRKIEQADDQQNREALLHRD